MHVYGWGLRVRPLRYFAAVFEGEDGAGEGVLEGDEARGAVVGVGGRDGVFLDIGQGQVVRIGHDGQGESTG